MTLLVVIFFCCSARAILDLFHRNKNKRQWLATLLQLFHFKKEEIFMETEIVPFH
jgi:hypothetical protein